MRTLSCVINLPDRVTIYVEQQNVDPYTINVRSCTAQDFEELGITASRTDYADFRSQVQQSN